MKSGQNTAFSHKKERGFVERNRKWEGQLAQDGLNLTCQGAILPKYALGFLIDFREKPAMLIESEVPQILQ